MGASWSWGALAYSGREPSVPRTRRRRAGTGDPAADRLDGPGDVHAPDGGLGLAQPHGRDHEADQVGQAGHDMPVAPVDAGRPHPDQHLVAPGHRPADVLMFQRTSGPP